MVCRGGRPASCKARDVTTMLTIGSILLRLRSGRRSLMALTLIAGSCLVVLIGALRAHPGSVGKRLSDTERTEVGTILAAHEPAWHQKAATDFPGDPWSQEDDFARSEYNQARNEAAQRAAHVGDALRAADESLRAQSTGRRVGVSPCKPRPFYD
jgi:hypothetical protein